MYEWGEKDARTVIQHILTEQVLTGFKLHTPKAAFKKKRQCDRDVLLLTSFK